MANALRNRFVVSGTRKWKRKFHSVNALALSALVVAITFPVQAQQPGKVPRIGYLSRSSLSADAARVEAFQHGLRDLGYVEGKNIVIEWRSGEGKLDRNLAHAAELVRLKVGVIVAAGSTEIRAAREATATVPIVMIRSGDPVGSGFVASLARPGGNITGLATLRPELSGKRLELLKEVVSQTLSRRGVREFRECGVCASVKRDRDRRGATRSEAAIPKHPKPQGF